MFKNISKLGSIIKKENQRRIKGGKVDGPFTNRITCWSGVTIIFTVFPETSADFFKYSNMCLEAGGSTIEPIWN